MQLIFWFSKLKPAPRSSSHSSGEFQCLLCSFIACRWVACLHLTSSGSWMDKPYAPTPPTRCWWERTACTHWSSSRWPAVMQASTPVSPVTGPARTPSTWSSLLQVNRNKQNNSRHVWRRYEHVAVIYTKETRQWHISFHSQRDAQGSVIRGEAAKHKRGGGSSCATGVPRRRRSLPTNLLEEREWVLHSQHRQNQVNETWNTRVALQDICICSNSQIRRLES